MLWELLNKSWQNILSDQKEQDYFQKLDQFLESEYKSEVIYPAKENIFNALNTTDFDDIKVVIIGQDPYHGEGQAHGLCFSVLPDVKVPPSLKNIYKELHEDIGMEVPTHGYLQPWAQQGVLLLNNVLTVKEAKAGSHQKKGWEKFTDRIIELINEKKEGVVFLLWGSPAQKKAAKVDEQKHFVLKAVHPSPLSAYRGFFGCKHFSKTNAYLISIGSKEIDWQIS